MSVCLCACILTPVRVYLCLLLHYMLMYELTLEGAACLMRPFSNPDVISNLLRFVMMSCSPCRKSPQLMLSRGIKTNTNSDKYKNLQCDFNQFVLEKAFFLDLLDLHNCSSCVTIYTFISINISSSSGR